MPAAQCVAAGSGIDGAARASCELVKINAKTRDPPFFGRSPGLFTDDLKNPAGTAMTVARRRDGRVAEGARLESVYTGNRIVGSNPTPSAILLRADALRRIGGRRREAGRFGHARANRMPYRPGQSSRVASSAPRAREPSFAHMIEG
jgi:hypothetical protein